jgi:RNA polymerase sigma-70 factor, ECF subfamily
MTDADFRDAFHRHKNVIYRFAYRMTGAEPVAEDIVQDCFAALWRKPEAFDSGRGSLRAFLLGIARNLALKHWRRQRPQEELEDDTSVCEPFDPAALERGDAVKKAILLLPALQREALILAEYEEMSLEDISKTTGAELAAVKSRLHRARQNLRRMLAPLLQPKGTFNATK